MVRIAFLSVVILVALGAASPAWACSCLGDPSFESAARRALVVVVGRVADVQTHPRSPRLPISVDVDLIWVAKGSVTEQRLRVWDFNFSNLCGGILRPLAVGTVA